MGSPKITEVRGKVKSLIVEDLVTKDVNGERRISGYASRPGRDRVGDVVEVKAFEQTMPKFMKNPVMLYMHQADEPIGTWDQYELRSDGLWLSGTLTPTGVDTADKAWALIQHKALRGLSIGFREIDAGMEDDGNYHIRMLDLLEVSPVSIPANQEALFQMDGGKLIGIKLLETEEVEEKTEPEAELESAEPAVITLDFTALREASIEKIVNILLPSMEERIDELERSLVKLVRFETLRLAQQNGVAVSQPPSVELGS